MHRVLVVESEATVARWADPDHGVAAYVERLGGAGDQVEVWRLEGASDLEALAEEIQASSHLPARVLVFESTDDPSIQTNPYDGCDPRRVEWADNLARPNGYEWAVDPVWATGRDSRLSPYSRWIASRLVQRAQRYIAMPQTAEDRISEPAKDSVGPIKRKYPATQFSRLLARANGQLALTGQDFMSIIDQGDMRGGDGPDITWLRTQNWPVLAATLPDIETIIPDRRERWQVVSAAALLLSHYPPVRDGRGNIVSEPVVPPLSKQRSNGQTP